MLRRSLLLWCIVLSTFLVGTGYAQDVSSMWNAAKRVKLGLDQAWPNQQAPEGGAATLNPLSPPNTPDIQVFNPSVYWQSENSIGVNFANPNQLMVSTNGQIPGSNPVVQQTWAFSTDGGYTWPGSLQSESIPPGIVDCYGDPVAFFDRSGRAYFATLGSPGGLYIVSTTNFGATWSTRSNADLLSSTNDDKEHVSADYSGTFPNNVYAAWTDFGIGSAPVVFSRSTDQGATWSSRTQLGIGSNRGQGVHIAIGPNGEVYVLWAHYTSGTQEAGLGFAKSTDGGVTFNTPAVAYPFTGIRTSNAGIAELNNARASSFPYGDVDRSNGPRRGWIYAVHPELVSGQADIFLHRSTDGGANWSSGIQVNGPDVQTGKWQWMPSIAVDPTSGGISVSYYSMDSLGSNFMTNRYMAYSADGGNTWDRFVISDVRALWAVQGTPNTNANYNGDYYETAATNGKAWPTWTDRRLGAAGSNNRAYVQPIIYSEFFGWVRGTITNLSGGAALSGVAVDFTDNINQQGSTTGGSGFYLAGAKVDTPGTTRNVTLRARKFGFRDTLQLITLTRNDTLTRNFAMTPVPNGTLVVRTVRRDSVNVSSGITVLFNGGAVASGSTDSLTGIFSTVLPLGNYDVLVNPPSPFGSRRFNSFPITTGSNPLYVVVRAVIENSPAAMRDTVAVNGLHAKTLQLTNTTATDTVPYRLSDDNALMKMRISKPAVQPRRVPLVAPQRPKGAPDTDFGFSPSGSGGPDAFGYRWVDSDSIGGGVTYNWVDITGVGTPVTSWVGSTDDGSFSTTLPWSFPFYGNGYTNFFFTTNGWLGFNSPSTEYNNVAIPSATEPNNAIYAWWDDLQAVGTSGDGTVYYYNDVANSQFIVQYNNVRHLSATGDALKFEAILKPNGEILLQYNSMVSPSNLTTATIGIENADGSVGLQTVYNAAYMHDNLAIRFYLPDASWLSENPSFGRINPGATQNITVAFDATGLLPGTTYNGKIIMDVTHPDVAGSILIPASLKVNPVVGPLIILSKTSLTFPATEIGFSRRDSLMVRNGGLAVLNLSSLTTTNSRFTVSPSSGSVNVGDSVKVIVTYTGVAPARIDTGSVIVLSNDPGSPRRDVTLHGTTVGLAHFVARPDTFAFTRNPTIDTTRVTFKVFNTGTDTLRYDLREGTTSPLADAAAIRRSRTQQPANNLPKGAFDPTPGETDSSGGPDAFGYRWIDSDGPGGVQFNWVDITTVGTEITTFSPTRDDGTAQVPMTLSVPFYGTTYTGTMNVCTNGFISFTSTSTSLSNTGLPSTSAPLAGIFALWDDLDLRTSGTAHYYDDAANNRFIVQFTNVPHYSTGGPYTFEYILYGNGQIIVQYLTVNPPVDGSTVGIQNETGTVGLQVSLNSLYPHNNLAVLFTSDLIPWMSTDPTSGVIAPGDSQAVQLRIHPSGMSAGTYYGVQRITGNTPDIGRVRVGLHIITGVGDNKNPLPTEFALSQNYPNPFNPTTTIKYDLPEQANVVLKIYNLLGQEVVTLTNSPQSAGYYAATWNGRNNFGLQVSSGVYFYRFEARSVSGHTFASLKKMLFLK